MEPPPYPLHLPISDQPLTGHTCIPLVVTAGHAPCEAIARDAVTVQVSGERVVALPTSQTLLS